jgi:hypothetical protein
MEYLADNTLRMTMLSAYLKSHECIELPPEDTDIFLRIFEESYTTDNNEVKYNITEITSVRIEKTPYGNKCFALRHKDRWVPTSIKKLCGQQTTVKQIIQRGLRYAIEPQIRDFRDANALNPSDICPVLNIELGPDAQVDHVIPFHRLTEYFLAKHHGITYFYSVKNKNYIIEQPHRTQWIKFHQKNAKLRYVSKKGNKIAHLHFKE